MFGGPDTIKDLVDAYGLFVTTEAHVWSGLLFEAMLTTECTGERAPPLGEDLVLLLDNQNAFGRGDLALALVKELVLLLTCPQNSVVTQVVPWAQESWLQPPHSSSQSMTSGPDPGGESGQPPKEGRGVQMGRLGGECD